MTWVRAQFSSGDVEYIAKVQVETWVGRTTDPTWDAEGVMTPGRAVTDVTLFSQRVVRVLANAETFADAMAKPGPVQI